MGSRIHINDNCLGIGACEAVAPHLFAVRDGTAELLINDPAAIDIELARDAIDACPMLAIEATEVDQ
ncbi:ferredoxin [Streptomyces sp. NL15-2K]|jgi:ferredoxin|uniref:ferredoxin n=1 Tax=Streptomyces sp. NL15-2K TaxID=376149 RepID=UPI000F55F6A3|nr:MULTISPECIES: ferredoxin [Actinomycetes]WKX14274.1 ferredoxin [Kutzneria buriramensis]GCB53384.1 hypothetical protein SNL152K_10741 [Streptomyces sp. NL15-2K]